MNRVKHWITMLVEAVRRSAKWVVQGKAVKEYAMVRELERARERGLELEREREHGLGHERELELERELERARERARAAHERASPAPYRWWKHPPRGRVGTHIGRYDDPVRMDTEVTAASTFGWTVKNVATTGSHINVGRTVTPAVLTGGLSLLLGASRTKEKYIVTFEHDGRVAEE